VCVIGTRVKEELFTQSEKAPGEYIRINGVYFKVIGVSKPVSNGGEAREEASKIVVPFQLFKMPLILVMKWDGLLSLQPLNIQQLRPKKK
jgi:hypothetical protein